MIRAAAIVVAATAPAAALSPQEAETEAWACANQIVTEAYSECQGPASPGHAVAEHCTAEAFDGVTVRIEIVQTIEAVIANAIDAYVADTCAIPEAPQ